MARGSKLDFSVTNLSFYFVILQDTSFTVPNLIENHEYEFRVMAANQNGVSEPLVTANKIVAKLDFCRFLIKKNNFFFIIIYFPAAPSAPVDPHAQAIGSNYVTLHWTKPNSDGGGPISGYWIEKREKGQDDDKWIRCNGANIMHITSYNVQNLIEDREYEFRIIAENEAGLSEPVQTSAIKVHDPNGPVAPEFIKRLGDVDAHEGKTVELEVEVNGNPKPYVQWFKGGREIHESLRYSLSSDGEKFKLTINNISSEEADEYTVKIKNKSGSKSSKANVTVRCKLRKLHTPRHFKTNCLKQTFVICKGHLTLFSSIF
jgi:titin